MHQTQLRAAQNIESYVTSCLLLLMSLHISSSVKSCLILASVEMATALVGQTSSV